MEAAVDWLWAFGASSLGWALYALLRHFGNLVLLVYVFRKELKQPGGDVRTAVKAMKEAAEALRLARGDVSPHHRDHIDPADGSTPAGDAERAHRPDQPPGDPPSNERPTAFS
jgi:hypothetical protein